MPDDRADARPGGRRRRRAVGPAGALPAPAEPARPVGEVGAGSERSPEDEAAADERLRREVPPHHGD